MLGTAPGSDQRKLGEIYDKIPRFVAAARFNLSESDVAPMMKNLELDIGLNFSKLATADAAHIKQVVKKFTGRKCDKNGVGMEIRYNFNPNDSARLRKDCDMAGHLIAAGLLPVYLVFSAISPREEAIARLNRAGWSFVVGTGASDFSKDLFGLNLGSILDQEKIRTEVDREVTALFDDIFNSPAYAELMKSRRGGAKSGS